LAANCSGPSGVLFSAHFSVPPPLIMPTPPAPPASNTVQNDAESPTAADVVFRLPSPLASARHALPAFMESTVVPMGLFYLCLVTVGIRGALIAALGWSYTALVRRLITRRAVPGVLLVGCVVLTLRTAIAFVTGSTFVYFMQPVAATAAVGVAFLVSALTRRPLIDRLARDFCPLEPEMLTHPVTRRVFRQLSLLWAAVMLVNAGVVTWLLLSTSLERFVVERTALSWLLTLAAIAVSTWHFTRSVRRRGIRLRWDLKPAAA